MESIQNVPQDNEGINGNSNGEAAKLALDTTSPPPDLPQSITSPVTSPPYWVQSHQRSVSNISVESIPVGAITLQDNTNSLTDTKNKFCWAKSVYIEDHVTVNEHRTGIGAFVVWNITVETLRVGSISPQLRYPQLTQHFIRGLPFGFASATRNSSTSEKGCLKHSQTTNPPCQSSRPRAWYPSSDPSFWKTDALDYNTFSSEPHLLYYPPRVVLTTPNSCILLNPEFSSSPVLKEFLFE